MKRFLPLVGAPYGMPLKTLIVSNTTPRTFPLDVSATAFSAPLTSSDHGERYAPATRSEAFFTNVRRFEMCAIFFLRTLAVSAALDAVILARRAVQRHAQLPGLTA